MSNELKRKAEQQLTKDDYNDDKLENNNTSNSLNPKNGNESDSNKDAVDPKFTVPIETSISTEIKPTTGRIHIS